MRAHGSILIARPPAEVFAYVTDPVHDLSWRSFLVASHATGPLAVGSTVRQSYSYEGRTVDVALEVTAFVPPESVELVASGPVRARIALHCAPEGEGTRFSMSGSAELTGLAAMFEGRIQRELDAAITADMKRLKAVLEA